MEASSQMNLVKKLSAKSIIGNVMAQFPKNKETGKPEVGTELKLYRIYGIANAIKIGQSTFGDWTAFHGQFEAVAEESGQVFRGGQCFLPEVAEVLLAPVVMKQPEGAGVQFAFDIGARITKGKIEGEVSYEYTVKPVIAMAENDALAGFKKELLALSAPKAAEEPAQVHAEPAPAASKSKSK